MATGHDITALKKEAAAKMARARQGMDDEVQRLRTKLSPSRVANEVMDRHSIAVLGSALGLGIMLSLLLFRSAPPPEETEAASAPRQAPRKNPLVHSALSHFETHQCPRESTRDERTKLIMMSRAPELALNA